MGTTLRGLVVAGLLLVASTAPGAVPSVSATEPSRLGSPEIFGWLPYWDMGATIDYGAVTTIAYFSIPATKNGNLVRKKANGKQTTQYRRWMSAGMTTIITRAHDNGVKVVLTVGRFAWSAGGITQTEALLSNPVARTTLVNEIVGEVTNRGVDGVNLDFEPILSSQRDNFAAFVRELRAAFDVENAGLQLTFEGSIGEDAETKAVMGELTDDGSADAVLLMGYFPRTDGRAGGKAPMESSSWNLPDFTASFTEHIAPDKVVIALPWYGRRYPTQTSEVNSLLQHDPRQYGSPTTFIYAKALPIVIAHGRLYDEVEQSAWTQWQGRACSSCPLTWFQLYYDDVDSLGAKYDWAIEQGLAGVGIWTLGYDNAQPEMWKELRVKFRGLVDHAAPTGSFTIAGTLGTCPAGQRRLLFSIGDGSTGSGPAFVRVSSDPTTSGGVLSSGVTYPYSATGTYCWSLPSTIYAQWRDVAGNWSGVASPN